MQPDPGALALGQTLPLAWGTVAPCPTALHPGCPKGTSPQGAEHSTGPGIRGDTSAWCHPAPGATPPWVSPRPWAPGQSHLCGPQLASLPSSEPSRFHFFTVSTGSALGPRPPHAGVTVTLRSTASPSTQPPSGKPAWQLVGSARGPAGREPPTPTPTPAPRHLDIPTRSTLTHSPSGPSFSTDSSSMTSFSIISWPESCESSSPRLPSPSPSPFPFFFPPSQFTIPHFHSAPPSGRGLCSRPVSSHPNCFVFISNILAGCHWMET